MDANVKLKFKEILEGKIKYTSQNLAVNIMVTRLQKKLKEDPNCFDACVQEVDAFAAKYPNMIKTDFANILAL